MTVQNIVEEIRQTFPLKEPQVIKKIDYFQKKYAGETRLLKQAGQLSDPSSNITWTLPSNCKEVIDINFYDSSDMPLYMEDLDLRYEIVFGKITFLKNDGTALSNLPDSVAYAYIDYVYFPSDIDDVTDSLEIDEELHEGVMAGIWKNLYASFPVEMGTPQGMIKARDWSAVRHWGNEYERYVREGKKRASVNKDSAGGKVPTDKLGDPIILKRQRLSTTTTIEISGLRAIYSKYIRFTATSPSTVTINEQFGWSTTIATPTITGTDLTVLSSAEFTATMMGTSNQGVRHERTDTSTWVWELYSGFGTIQFEIWER